MKKIVEEFKKFISRGNVIDMAVGIIIGGAFTAIVNSIVNDLFMPFIGIITGGNDFNSWSITIGSATIQYGAFLTAVLNFFIIAIVVFFMVKGINSIHHIGEKECEEDKEPDTKKCPYCLQEIPYHATKCSFCASEVVDESIANSKTSNEKKA